MKKSELKTNMLVEMRNGGKYLVKKDLPATDLTYREESNLFIDETEGYMSFCEYSEDLLCYDDDVNQIFYDWGRDEVAEGYDIMKVYTPYKICAFFPGKEFDLDNYDLLWAREEPKNEPKVDPEIQELHKMIESIELTLAEIKTTLARKEKENND